MNRADAEREVARLNQERPKGAPNHWFARERDGEWSVVKVAGLPTPPTSIRADVGPEQTAPEDPRSSIERNIAGGPWV